MQDNSVRVSNGRQIPLRGSVLEVELITTRSMSCLIADIHSRALRRIDFAKPLKNTGDGYNDPSIASISELMRVIGHHLPSKQRRQGQARRYTQ